MSPSITTKEEQGISSLKDTVEEKKKLSTSNNNNTTTQSTKLTKASRNKVTLPVKSRYGRAIKHVYLNNGIKTISSTSSIESSLSNTLKNGETKVNDVLVVEEKENGGGGDGNDGVAIQDEKMEINMMEENENDVGDKGGKEQKEIIVNVKMEEEEYEEEVKKEMDQQESIANDGEKIKVKNETSVDDKKWFVGQIAWAHISNYPYWPCIITLEPGTNVYFKEKAVGRQKLAKLIHVQYFGDKGRHGWVTENSMMEYHGIDDFYKLSAETLTGNTKHDKRYPCFIIKKQIKDKWQIAVDEAEQMVIMKVEDRIDIADKTCATKIKIGENRKRGRPPRLSIEPNAKKAKIDTTITTTNNNNNVDNDEFNKINLTTNHVPPTPPSSIKDSSDESSIIRKSNGKRRKTLKAGDFEIYFLAKKNYMINLPENTTDADLRTYLKESWDKLGPWQRGKFSSESTPNFTPSKRRKKKSLDSLKEEDNHENSPPPSSTPAAPASSSSSHRRRRRRHHHHHSNSSSSSKSELNIEKNEQQLDKDENSTTTFSSIDLAKKNKSLNLFKGTRLEKVCQICEKTGKLIRCRGPCYSYFHLDCVKPGDSESECDDADEDAQIELQKKKSETPPIESSSSSPSPSFSPSPALSPVPEETTDSTPPPPTKEEEEEKEKEELVAKKDVAIIIKKECTIEEENFKCIDCLSGVAPACFICNEREEERIRCSIAACGKHYHSGCLKLWPQSHWIGGKLTCPYHMCHTCISDNPQSYHSRTPHDKLARCVRCPSAYHASSSCLPAGSKILTGNQIICPKHYISPHAPLNAAWCFLCTRGGSLICCDTCPTSFHAECLGINAPAGAYICEDCETGRLPLYGEVVWVKLGTWRWWPSRICFPHEIPLNLKSLSHSSGEFCVMFFGTHNYYWAHRGRCFLYQDGDLNAKVTAIGKKHLDESYKKAVDEANDLYQYLKNIKLTTAKDELTIKNRLKPPPYIKLKQNKPVGNVKPVVEIESIVACECKSTWDNPCSSDTDCLNRILSIECDPSICPAGTKCNNQSFVSRNYPNMEPFHTSGRGWGLKSLDNIKKGQFVIEYVGEIIDENEYKKRLTRKKELRNENYYFLTIDNYRLIDAEPKGNLSRFMNHSCQPNCETQKWTVNGDTRIGIFAIRDIDINEELTFNYNLSCEGEKKKPCLCGAPNCSGFIGLKAQKLQITNILSQQQQVIETPDNNVKRRRKPTKRIYKCWTCGIDINDETHGIQCELKSCRKRYHRDCIKILEDNTRFSCPWHHCLDCSRRTSAHCSFCSIAYCPRHLQGKLTEQKERGGYLCKAHEDLLFEDDQDAQDIIGGGGGDDDKIPLSPEYPEPEEEEEESDEDFDAASLLADSDSPIAEEDVNGDDDNTTTSVSTPISIIEVELNNEENEESKIDDASSDVDLDNNSGSEKNEIINPMGYTTHQLHDIIGIGDDGNADQHNL